MNVSSLVTTYFSNSIGKSTIEVFDAENIYKVYTHIVEALMLHPDIEVSVLQSLSYCFYEVLDNVLTHSGKICGTVILYHDEQGKRIKVLVADDGKGVAASLKESAEYSTIDEAEALRICIKDRVTDGKGMGFGLYSTSKLIEHSGIRLTIHSGTHVLEFDGKASVVNEAAEWQGTIVYMEIVSDCEFDPNVIVESRTDVEGQFNETFLANNEFEELW